MEAFHLELTTIEGYPLLIGGLCEDGTKALAAQEYKAAAFIRFHKANDGYFIDRLLSEALRSLSQKSVFLICASICIPGAESGGGIIGDPFEKERSASGEEKEIHGGRILALPGGPGLFVGCSKNEFLPFEEILREETLDPLEKASRIRTLLGEKNFCYLLVLDGCGEKNCAQVYESDG